MQVAYFERVKNRSSVRYTTFTRQQLHMFKYNGMEVLARPMALMMAETIYNHYKQVQFGCVTYVPMDENKQKQRGYNQAHLLALEISKRISVPMYALLARTAPSEAQSKKSRVERLKIGKGVFIGREDMEFAFSKQTVLLIDDVYTTGATIRACTQVLKDQGAEHVYAITFAR
ncbi:ComF family protein [Hazenella sp. IB182357]|uniref:ComF family protein n=1 Tax=Polycladospora coralii TaxID=2771432 RepID=A0A926N6J2_9BACL|nr:phosphoribosyltransferase family protein [Polycladospora coralii]MBD1372191.1 ComF family protein [Polycladospora coralii]